MLLKLLAIIFLLSLGPVVTYADDRITRKLEIFWPCYESEARRARWFSYDLDAKIREMLEDPFTMESDWREILPVCRYSDEWCARTNPDRKDLVKKEELVRQIMA